MAERALAHELVTSQQETNVSYFELLGQLQMEKKEYEEALKSFEHALVLRHEVCFSIDQFQQWTEVCLKGNFEML